MSLKTHVRIAAVAVSALVTSQGFAQRPHAIAGVVRDSISRQPLAGAMVDVRSASLRLTARTDEAGAFRFGGLLSGRYTYSVLRIGFAEQAGEIDLSDRSRDAAVEIEMRPVAQTLDAFRVRGDIAAIYGMVATLPDFRPVAGATVQVLGGSQAVTTDSAGGFFVPADNPGLYMVRITAEGFADRLFNIEIPRGRAVEASRLLDPGSPGFDGPYQDLAQRLRYRSMSSALVPGADVRHAGSNVIDGLQGSPTFARQGLRFGPSVCLFVNGVPRPGATIEAIRVEEVEAVEVYASSGDRSGELGRQWPSGAPCGQIFRSFTRRSGSTANIVRYVVIWLRK